jgi:hypothetical protein
MVFMIDNQKGEEESAPYQVPSPYFSFSPPINFSSLKIYYAFGLYSSIFFLPR